MSAPHLGGALNVHGSSSSFAGGHSFASNSVGFHGNSFGGGFHGNGINSGFGWHGGGWGGGWHGGWGGWGWRGGWGCCGFGWGWGWGGFGWGWGWGGFWGPGWGWGWPGYSIGYYPYWPGYYGDPGYGISYGDNGDYSSSNNGPVDNSSGNYNAGNYNAAPVAPAPDNSGGIAEPEPSPNDNPITGDVSSSRPTVLLYLKDGTTYAASDYWLQDGELHYTVNYGGEGTLHMDELDLQRTVNENARRGVNFSLHPNPASANPQPSSNGNPASGSSTDQSNHYRPPQYGNGGSRNNGNSAAPAATPTPAPAPPVPQTQTTSQTL
jgi:hypothetical protein